MIFSISSPKFCLSSGTDFLDWSMNCLYPEEVERRAFIFIISELRFLVIVSYKIGSEEFFLLLFEPIDRF